MLVCQGVVIVIIERPLHIQTTWVLFPSGGTLMLFPNFALHKVNILSSSSVLLFFLQPEVSDNNGVDEGYKPQIIWLHSSNNLKILLVNAFAPNFCLPQSQSSGIKFISFIFLPLEVSDSKTQGGGEGDTSPQHFTRRANASSNFCETQSQSSVIKFSFFYFFLPPEVRDNIPGVDEGNKPSNNFGYIRLIFKRSYIDYSAGYCFRPPNVCMTQSQSSVIKFSFFLIFFFHPKSVITNLGWMRGMNPQIILVTFVQYLKCPSKHKNDF